MTRYFRPISLIFSLFISLTSTIKASGTEGFDQSHLAWTNILQKNITVNGKANTVNYKAIKNDPEEFNSYLKSLTSVTIEEFNLFSEKERLAFLINAYNAFTVKLIVDNYPLKSIKDLGTVLKSPWKIKFFDFLGETRYLDDIEQNMIRKNFNEPRIHFAVVCASIGCPALRNEAYNASALDQQLDDAALNFLSDSTRNRYSSEKQSLEISSIFKWYGGDFVKKYGSVVSFIAPRITSDIDQQNSIKDNKATITYLDYDWSLNETK